MKKIKNKLICITYIELIMITIKIELQIVYDNYFIYIKFQALKLCNIKIPNKLKFKYMNNFNIKYTKKKKKKKYNVI